MDGQAVNAIMMRMNRRDFLTATAALLAPRLSASSPARIEILTDEPIGTISPNIYGHFTEHLGGCIYDGIWVGEGSKIPNVGGIRKELVDNLKLLNPPVIRWPGGCFADSYNWRDGVGPRDRRPTRTNFWADTPYLEKAPDGPQKYEPNQFGTNEFARFCKLVGAAPYFAADLRALQPYDFYQWVEYCNSPAGTTTLAKLRAEGGDTEPFGVRFWGVGNESWGCGGNFTGDEYAVEFRRFTEWVPRFGVPLSFIASGPNVADYAWTRSFFQKLTEKGNGALRRVFGCALHYYCGGASKGQSTEFTEKNWYQLLSDAGYMEELIQNHWQIMGETDKQHSVKLVVDEWGAWHDTDPSINPAYLWAYWPTLRDALVSGITLDIFNRHADKVTMANAAQLINNIHTSFVAVGDKFAVTPVYHVFRMYAPHQGNTSVRSIFESGLLNVSGAKGLQALSGSASLKNKRLILTVVNPHARDAQETEIHIRAANISAARASVLSSTDIRAHNSFDNPHAMEPVESSVKAGTPFVYQFAPASVTRLDLDLA
ncbi:MAG TPA: alpha-L-arabinofuranosidase C-terminal domain-containing protein [Bryobacteraceae bacterium]|nr:alpha-L-arabinofuranosidase C-terminal domain-containing protein [Bryobacteraceae bacterium]